MYLAVFFKIFPNCENYCDCFDQCLKSVQVTVESIDDVEEMQIMDEAFDILGFTHEEKFDVYKVTASCMVFSR